MYDTRYIMRQKGEMGEMVDDFASNGLRILHGLESENWEDPTHGVQAGGKGHVL